MVTSQFSIPDWMEATVDLVLVTELEGVEVEAVDLDGILLCMRVMAVPGALKELIKVKLGILVEAELPEVLVGQLEIAVLGALIAQAAVEVEDTMELMDQMGQTVQEAPGALFHRIFGLEMMEKMEKTAPPEQVAEAAVAEAAKEVSSLMTAVETAEAVAQQVDGQEQQEQRVLLAEALLEFSWSIQQVLK
jgi:hypothetical protein